MFVTSKKNIEKSSVSRSDLEAVIADAVRKFHPECAKFVGVIVQRTPQSRFDSNWTIRGVRFGSADRNKSLQAIGRIVELMQQDFVLSADNLREE
jgi:hypothetical protein